MRWLLALPLMTALPAYGEDAPRISSGFGVRSDPLNGRPRSHRGLDMPGRTGTPIVAAAGGVVRFAGRRGGYGHMIEVTHPDGSATRYAHLSRILVRPGEAVDRGQLIAEMGSTGRSTGSHLHFEYRIGGVAVDPRGYLREASRESFVTGPDDRDAEIASPHRSRFSKMRAAAPPAGVAQLPSGGEVAR
jgi:murein DD-endopeptidase MepM/ murein hydrolase activator NlpD